MRVADAVVARRSTRAFRPDPVPKAILEEIMRKALWSPSWGNTQPWNFTIVGGKTLNKIREESVKLLEEGVPPRPDFPFQTEFNEIQTVRYKGLGKELFKALGIAREDTEKRKAHNLAMTRLFGAPCLIYLHFGRGFNPYALMDGGIILQTIALLAKEQGLGTCILTRSVSYPEVVRKHAGIPAGQDLIMGIGIGYEIPDHPANRFRSRRGEPGEFIQWVDMD
jgi:nitroreductase